MSPPQPSGGSTSAAPTLSVTVLNYNYGHFLPACLDSILRQTFRDFELVVIDDASSDGSLDVVNRYLEDPRVKLVAHAENHGFRDSLIEGSEQQAPSRYLTVISADDLVQRDDAFERQIGMLERAPAAGFCFSDYARVSEVGKLMSTHATLPGDDVISGERAFGKIVGEPLMAVLHSGAMIRRSAYERAGGYSRDVAYAVDLALWLALSLRGDVAYVAEPLYAYRQHGSQLSESTDGYASSIKETLQLVDAACEEAGRRGLVTGTLRRDAVYGYMLGWATHEAFKGEKWTPLRRCARAVGLRPVEAVTSRELWIILLRVALGRRGFAAVRSAARRMRGTASGRAAATRA